MGLRWSDVDQINRQAKTRIKGGRTIRRPLTAKLTALISANQPKVGPFVFTYKCRQSRGKRQAGERYPLTPSLIRDRFAEAKENAGIEDFRFHDLRHTRGTRIVRQTGSIAHASKALAHTNLKTTMRYAHVLDDDVRWALEASESRTIPGSNDEKARKA
jgi:integrase